MALQAISVLKETISGVDNKLNTIIENPVIIKMTKNRFYV